MALFGRVTGVRWPLEPEDGPDWRPWGLLGLTAAAVLALWWVGPIHQPAAYHLFADRRACLGLPNGANVLSNLPFLLVGLAGLRALGGGVPPGGLPVLRPAYLVFFAATAALFPTSGYYHLWPADGTLVWDRLAMAIAFMAFLAMAIGEFMAPRAGAVLLWPLVLMGIGSVAWWRLGGPGDGGDLRPYVLVQFLPMILIPCMALTYRPLLGPVSYLWALLGCYGLAKALELLDGPIFRATQAVSGHTLKHLVAALGIACFLLGLYRRRPAVPGGH